MGIFTPDVHNLRELYKTKLERALSSERQIVQTGLPGMIEDATNPELAEALRAHLEESRMHVSRLERILDVIEGEENETKCKVTAALISEASSSAKDAPDAQLRDVLLIAAGNEVEHHEIAVYGTLKTWAEVLGEFEQAEILDRTLAEEKKADELLTKLSRQINVEAPVA
jgi:ferritin-like metal-binding protein YciE